MDLTDEALKEYIQSNHDLINEIQVERKARGASRVVVTIITIVELLTVLLFLLGIKGIKSDTEQIIKSFTQTSNITREK